MAASFAQPRWPSRFWWLAVAAAAGLLLTQAVRAGGDTETQLPVIEPREPISQVDARLLAEGWAAKPDRDPLPFERRLAHNTLASLSGCSGTGMGFCRYDYQRGGQRFAVVTVPGPDGSGVVHNTFEVERGALSPSRLFWTSEEDARISTNTQGSSVLGCAPWVCRFSIKALSARQ